MRERVEASGGSLEAGPTRRRRLSGRRHVEVALMMIRVVLADDQVLVRTGFRRAARRRGRHRRRRRGRRRRAGRSAGGRAASRRRADGHPHAGRRRPDGGAREIAAPTELADVKVLVLTTFELDEYVYEALRAGASGFLVKHTEPAELIRAVRVVAAGEALLSPGVTRRLDRRVHRDADRRVRAGSHGSSSCSPPASARSWRSSPKDCRTRRSPSAGT